MEVSMSKNAFDSKGISDPPENFFCQIRLSHFAIEKSLLEACEGRTFA